MRLRIFEAPTTPQAMAEMRRVLGADAIIVATQETGSGVRLTAALDHEEEDLGALLAPEAAAPPEAIERRLVHHGVLEAQRRTILDHAGAQAPAEPQAMLARALEQCLAFAPIGRDWPRPLMLVGPPGAGKTATVAKLAAARRIAGSAVAVMTCDAGRAGGVAQLEQLLEPMQLTPVVAERPEALARARQALDEDTALIIDSTGFNPYRGDELGQIAEFLHAARAEPVVVLPAGASAEDTLELAANFRAIGAARALTTRLDIARRLGSVIALGEAGLALAEASISPLIGKPLAALSGSGLARLIMREPEQAKGGRG